MECLDFRRQIAEPSLELDPVPPGDRSLNRCPLNRCPLSSLPNDAVHADAEIPELGGENAEVDPIGWTGIGAT